MFEDYEQITHQDPNYLPKYAATGTANSLLANRLSYFYNTSGPSMTVDTACSGSLVAVHLAAQGLRTHETSMVCGNLHHLVFASFEKTNTSIRPSSEARISFCLLTPCFPWTRWAFSARTGSVSLLILAPMDTAAEKALVL